MLKPLPRRQRGLAAVELALVLPLLLLLLLAMIEYGTLFWRAQQIGNAAREGARAGIRATATSGDVTAAVNAVMLAAGLDGSGFTTSLSADPASLAPGAGLTVTVSVPYTAIDLTGFPVPAPTSVVRATTMAKEGS